MAAMSAREFNQYSGRAKALAQTEPVFITDRGKVTHVLLNIGEYLEISKKTASLASWADSWKGLSLDFDFATLRAAGSLREADLDD